jgi:hypothetical protein
MADSSELQNYLVDISDGNFETVVAAARVKRETKALRARFPPHLTDLASCLQVVRPKETTITSLGGGANGSCCTLKKYKVHLSVHLGQEDVNAIDKELTLTLCRWRLYHIYVSGSASSETISASIKYGKKQDLGAFASEYSDPGIEMFEATHGGVKTVLKNLLRDLGGGGDLDEIEMLGLLMGDDLEAMIDVELKKRYPSLRKVIIEQLELE